MSLKLKFIPGMGKYTGRKITTIVGAILLAVALSSAPAQADIIGFGSDNLSLDSYTNANPGNTTTATGTTSPSWTINSLACCSGNAVSINAGTSTLTLGGGQGYNGGSAFANTVQSTAPGWTASFTFNEAAGLTTDQVTWAFVLQNDPNGATARDAMKSDYTGGGSPLTPAAEVVFANGGSNILNVGFLNNTSGNALPGYSATTSSTLLDFTAAPITANLSYSGMTLTLNLIQGSNTYTTSETVDIPTLVGSNAYVGFDANRMDQGVVINNFSFTAAAVPEPSTVASLALGLVILLAVMRLRRQARV